MNVLITKDADTLKRLAGLADALDASRADLDGVRGRLAKLQALETEKEAAIARLRASKVKIEAPENRVDALLNGEAAPTPEQVNAARESRRRNAEIEDRIAVETADLEALRAEIPRATRDVEQAETAVATARDELADAIGEVMFNETLEALAAVARDRLGPLSCIAKLCGDTDAVGSITRLIQGDPLQFIDRYVSRGAQRDVVNAREDWRARKQQMEKAWQEFRQIEEGRIIQEVEGIERAQDAEPANRRRPRQEIEQEVRKRVLAQRPAPTRDELGPEPKNPVEHSRSYSALRDHAGLPGALPAPEEMLAMMIENIRAAQHSGNGALHSVVGTVRAVLSTGRKKA